MVVQPLEVQTHKLEANQWVRYAEVAQVPCEVKFTNLVTSDNKSAHLKVNISNLFKWANGTF